MNQIALVEISRIKNEKLYRALLPVGVPWAEAREALLEMAQEIDDLIQQAELQQKQQEEKDIQEQPVELVN